MTRIEINFNKSPLQTDKVAYSREYSWPAQRG